MSNPWDELPDASTDTASPDAAIASGSPSGGNPWDDLPDAPQAPKVDPNADYQAFRQQYLDQAKESGMAKAWDIAKGIGNVAKTAVVGAVTAPYNIVKGVADIAGTQAGNGGGVMQGIGNAAQSGLEAAGSTLYDTLNAGRQGASYLADKYKEGAIGPTDLLNPAALAGSLGKAAANSNPNEQEIQDAYHRQQTNEAYANERKGDVVTKAFGTSNPFLAKGISDIPNTLGALGMAKGLAAAAGRTAIGGGLADIAQGTAKSVATAISPTQREAIVNAFATGVRLKNIDKVSKAVDAVLSDLPAMVKESGINFDSPVKAQELGNYAKANFWKNRTDAIGQPIILDGTPAYDKAIDVVGGKRISNTSPPLTAQEAAKAKALTSQLPAESAAVADKMKFLKAPMTPMEMEANIQQLNGFNAHLYEMSPAQRAATLAADPVAKARMAAADGLRDELYKALPDVGTARAKYGAWTQWTDMAQKQAARQARLESNTSLYSGMGKLASVGTGLAAGMLSHNPLIGLGAAAAELGMGEALSHMRTPNFAFSRAARISANTTPANTAAQAASAARIAAFRRGLSSASIPQAGMVAAPSDIEQ